MVSLSPSDLNIAIGDSVPTTTTRSSNATMPPLVTFQDLSSSSLRQPQQQPTMLVTSSTVTPIHPRDRDPGGELYPLTKYLHKPRGDGNFQLLKKDVSNHTQARQDIDHHETTTPLPRSPLPTLSPTAPEQSRQHTLPLPARLQKHKSEPANKEPPKRRSIFDCYWKQEDHRFSSIATTPNATPSSVLPPATRLPKTTRRRSSSLPKDDSPFWDLSIRDFIPPQGSAFVSQRQHFQVRSDRFLAPSLSPDDNETFTSSSSFSSYQLPPLPRPLQRFYSEGRVTTLGGMYPLVRAQPVLRQSSYDRSKCPTKTPETLDGPFSSGPGPLKFPGVPDDNWNLTRSVSQYIKPTSSKLEEDEEECTTAATLSSTSISSAATTTSPIRRGVSFDPRITVTEFEDAHPRLWFTDSDLERFRMETVLVAQKYLLRHPEMIEVYNKPVLDPVTGTMRKKALFSMPALRAGDDSSSSSSSSSTDKKSDLLEQSKSMKELAYQHVKNILVADRNKIILDLFRRSLRSLFPHARITTAQSGDEALQYFQDALSSSSSSSAGYDIVIAEERLHQPLTVTGTPVLTSGKSSLLLSSSSVRGSNSSDLVSSSGKMLANVAGPRHVRHDSLFGLPSHRSSSASKSSSMGCSGSELFRRISSTPCRQNCDTTKGHGSSTSKSGETPPESISPPTRDSTACLLIGVSVQPDQDVSLFQSVGADVVWGKPPPRMDDPLRDQLVTLLLRKRSPAPTAASSATEPFDSQRDG